MFVFFYNSATQLFSKEHSVSRFFETTDVLDHPQVFNISTENFEIAARVRWNYLDEKVEGDVARYTRVIFGAEFL